MGESGYMESVPVDWISLRDVEDKDLEMLREERNRWSTRSNLEDCRVISQEDQTRWFVGGGARGIKVAECDGAVVGIARIKKGIGVGCYTVGADVFERHRGLGYGSAVFGAACKMAEVLASNCLDLWVFVDNTRAVNVYKKHGFTFDMSSPVIGFMRPLAESGEPVLRHYVRMVKHLQ